MKKVTINDIARLSNVSRTTISRYLNGKFENMSDETRAKIEQHIKELDYRPNRQAQLMKSGHSRLIGISVADVSNFYTSRLLKGILNRLRESSYRSIIVDSNLSQKLEQENLQKLQDEQVDGLLLQPLAASSEAYQLTFPVVQIDRYVEPLIWSAVTSDNFEDSKALVELVVEKGYERIIVLSPPVTYSTVRIARYEGLLAALKNTNVEIVELLAPEAKDMGMNDPIWQELTDKLHSPQKTVVYAFNTPLLYHCVEFFQAEGLKTPDDLGLVGYDDESWGSILVSGLTTLEQPLVKIGYTAANRLLRQIEGKEQESPEVLKIPSQLNQRKSL